MTAKQLVIEIEEDLDNAYALIDVIGMAATSEAHQLDSESLERVAGMAIIHSRKAIEACDNVPEN